MGFLPTMMAGVPCLMISASLLFLLLGRYGVGQDLIVEVDEWSTEDWTEAGIAGLLLSLIVTCAAIGIHTIVGVM